MSIIDRVRSIGSRKPVSSVESRMSSALTQEVKKGNTTASADVDMAITPPAIGNTYLKSSGMYYDTESEDELAKLRDRIRDYSVYNDTLSIVVNLCSMFIAKSPRIDCDSSRNKKTLAAIFPSNELEEFLQQFTKEYLISGEATSIAYWLDDDNDFTTEDIQNPDAITMTDQSVVIPSKLQIEIDRDAMAAIRQFSDRGDDYDDIQPVYVGYDSEFEDESDIDDEHKFVMEQMADHIDDATNSLMFDLDDDAVIRIVNKKSSWSNRGVSLFAPALAALAQSESLDAALFEQLNMLITPTIIGQVGLKANELGPNSSPWIPSRDEMNSIRDSYKQMLMGTKRIGVFPIGVKWENAFAQSQIRSLDQDYQRCESKILRCVSAGKGLLDGSTGGPWSSNAINRDVFSSYLQSVQVKIAKAFQKRIDLAVRKMGLCKTEIDRNGNESPILTDDGKKIYEEAELKFDDGIMKDANQVLQTAMNLKNNGVPISKQTLVDLADIGLNISEETVKLKKEAELTDDSGVSDIVNMGGSDDSGSKMSSPKSPLNRNAL